MDNLNHTTLEELDETIGGDWRSLELVRNALRVSGQEVGHGDHWPVIYSTLNKLTEDYTTYHKELAVSLELKNHLNDIIATFEQAVLSCDEDLDPEDAARFNLLVLEMREIYEARFAPVDLINLPDIEKSIESQREYAPYRWALNIISMLEENADEQTAS